LADTEGGRDLPGALPVGPHGLDPSLSLFARKVPPMEVSRVDVRWHLGIGEKHLFVTAFDSELVARSLAVAAVEALLAAVNDAVLDALLLAVDSDVLLECLKLLTVEERV
jgi:hypothetical protein